MKRNYGYMAEKCLWRRVWNAEGTQLPALVREKYDSKTLKHFEFIDIYDESSSVTEIKTLVVFEEHGNEIKKTHTFRFLSEDDKGGSVVRGTANSHWGIVTWII